MEISIKQFNELTPEVLYDILELRSEVFVVEQDCVYQDVDGKDKIAIHVLGHHENQLVAYTRIFKGGDYFKNTSFGRVVVAKNFRNFGFGKTIVKGTLDVISEMLLDSEIEISAQTYLKEFYMDFGFKKVGKEYLEDGIPHIRMIRQAKS